MKRDLIESELTHLILGCFFEVHHVLGPGLLEQVYLSALERELVARGRQVGREVSAPIFYKGERIATQRLDMVVDAKVIVEAKSTEKLPPFACRQLMNYLRATRLEVGLLLHFGPEPAFKRMVFSNARK